jgi:hypothetical protein
MVVPVTALLHKINHALFSAHHARLLIIFCHHSNALNTTINSELSKSPGAEQKSSPAPVKKGECPLCNEAVYSDDFRQFFKGAYYHEECIAVNNKLKNSVTKETALCRQQLDSTTSSINNDPNVVMRGACGVCQKDVFSNQPRTFEKGSYYHEACLSNTEEASLETTAVSSTKVTKAVEEAPGAPVRRGECGICKLGVYTNQARKFENGTYYHEECLSARNISHGSPIALTKVTGGVQASDGSVRILESVLKPKSVMSVPTTARECEGTPIPTVRFSDDVIDRGLCGVCDQPVLTDQLRTIQNGCYFHDECLLADVSKRLSDLNAYESLLSVNSEREEIDPTRTLVVLNNGTEIASFHTRTETSVSQRSLWESASPPSTCAAGSLSAMLEDGATPIVENRQTQIGASPSKSLIECCSSLATVATPRYEGKVPSPTSCCLFYTAFYFR